MLRLLLAVVSVAVLLLAGAANRAYGAQAVPPLALKNCAALARMQRSIWPDAPTPVFLCGQGEQESCVSLSSPKCWNPLVELKTRREYGFGIPQTTIAYREDGSVRFNKWLELRARYPSLKDWSWDNRFAVDLQLTAMVEMMKGLCGKFGFAATGTDKLAMCLASYNGGEGAVMQDRVLCSNTPGCDPSRWFDNIELHSYKSRVPFNGYGKSAFQINREYPRNVFARAPKYQPFFVAGGSNGADR